MDMILYLLIGAYIIYYIIRQINGRAELKKKIQEVEWAKEVCEAQGYILEFRGDNFTGRSPQVDLKKQLNDKIYISLKISFGRVHIGVPTPNEFRVLLPGKPAVCFDNVELPIDANLLKRLEENVLNGRHFEKREESGYKIKSEKIY